MNARVSGSVLMIMSAVFVYACATDNPTRPEMSFVAPAAQQPVNGAAYNFTQQPLTLTIVNSFRTGGSPVTYTVEVSNRPDFGSTAFIKEGVAEDPSGTTSVQLAPTPLPGNTTYYWRWRALSGGVLGEPSPVATFFVRPNIVLGTPQLQGPADGTAVFGSRPTFTLKNTTATGPAGTIFYEFQVSGASSFSPLIASSTIQSQSGQTSWIPTVDLPEQKLFWRARAKDVDNDITGPFSSVAQFERKFGIDITKVVVKVGPTDVATWPETGHLYNVYFDPGDDQILCTEYEANWPETDFEGGPSKVVSNQWNFVLHDGVWYGGAGPWMRPNQFCKRDYDQELFTSSYFGQFPFNQTVLHSGDIFGVMMSTPARPGGVRPTTNERSNIVLVAWPPGR